MRAARGAGPIADPNFAAIAVLDRPGRRIDDAAFIPRRGTFQTKVYARVAFAVDGARLVAIARAGRAPARTFPWAVDAVYRSPG